MIESVGVRGAGGPAQGKVPFEEICLEGGGGIVGRRCGGEFLGLTDCGRWLAEYVLFGRSLLSPQSPSFVHFLFLFSQGKYFFG